MEDPKVLFADTTARRAELMKATERFKTSIQSSVDSLKDDAAETGRTVAFVAAVAIGVFVIANVLLPKSDEYRRAEKKGERDEYDDDDETYASYDEYDDDDEAAAKSPYKKSKHQLVKENKESTRKSAIGGLVGGLVTSVLTNIAREQLSNVLARVRSNNAINQGADPSTTEQYHQKAPTQPVSYSS
jgi:hypothetical protein